MSMVTDESFAEVWERTIRPDQADLPPDAARYFLKLQFADAAGVRPSPGPFPLRVLLAARSTCEHAVSV